MAATPLTGHVMPLLAIARGLAERGHDVTVLTGSKFRPQATSAAEPASDAQKPVGIAEFLRQ
jgi:UDP:flavonoid glycosyltransferase YjiC (YdhE family)